MPETFSSPSEQIYKQDQFEDREVGLTHPDVPGFIRICNSGDIEIVAGEGLSILLNPRSRSITFVADHIKFITKHDGGLRWNNVAFNDRAVAFNEPTFITVDDTREVGSIYQGVDYYFPDRERTTKAVPRKLEETVRRFKTGDDD